MNLPAYSVVIATLNRPEPLRIAMESLADQTYLPEKVVIVDASDNDDTRSVSEHFAHTFHLEWRRSHETSAARQRNAGACNVNTPLIAFMDDDVILDDEVFEMLCLPFARMQPMPGGVAGRIVGLGHKQPQGWLRRYYRIQAGFSHRDYGALCFGPAINTLPCYPNADGPLIKSDWLNSTCVVYQYEAFSAEQFPDFTGYSFMEDAHLSLRIGQQQELYFHRDARYEHRSQSSQFKRDHINLARSRITNQRIVAHDVMGLDGFELGWKLALHRLFICYSLLRCAQASKWSQLAGTWI